MSDTTYRKKLIEVALPLEAINAASARDKSIRHGHPSTLHLWWAPRPLPACRAVVFAQLVDDPSAWPELFTSETEQDNERARLFRLLEKLVTWEGGNDPKIVDKARCEIARSIARNLREDPPADPEEVFEYLQTKGPTLFDPFCGRGLLSLEAQRLGVRARGSDLNPVATLTAKALVDIPQRFAGQPPINPDAQAELARGGRWNCRGAEGLADDVRYYGRWVSEEAGKRIGYLYPHIEVSEDAVRQQPSLANIKGEELTVIAWLWARTVASPNPAARRAHVPLVSSFMLCTKPKKKAWVEPVLDASAPDGYRFEIVSGSISPDEEARKKAGTKVGRGASFRCLLTDTPIPADYVKAEGAAGRFGWRLMAIIADGPRGRIYLPPREADEQLAKSVQPDWKPDIPLATHPQYMSVTNYGPAVVGDLFMARQAHALNTFSDLVAEAREKVLEDAQSVKIGNSTRPLAEGGNGYVAYADAVATYLGINVSRLANRQSTNTFWDITAEKVQQVFAMQALPMRWDTVEANPFSNSSGNFLGQLKYLTKVIDKTPLRSSSVHIEQADAASADFSGTVLSTDPPYFDNVPYADLSDFFYPWLRRSMRPIFPQLFRTRATPKVEELVADSQRHGSSEAAEEFFLTNMADVLKKACSDMDTSVPAAIFYAFRQSERDKQGVSSTGWEAFLRALVEAGLLIDGTWPVKTELTGNLKKKWNALASSIVLSCRKRPQDAPVTTRGEFVRLLRRELPPALRLLQQGSIAPVDMAQASIGPGMAVFTRYAKVLEADDSPMTVKTALQLINAELDTFLSEQEAEYDAWTRFAITWFETHGMDPAGYGEAETLATARGVSVSGVEQAGLIEARGGKARLIARDEMSADWDPVEDQRPTVWESTQHLIRRLDDGGEDAAAALLGRLGSMAEPARDLAYRLFGICERKGWSEEGRAYNGLVVVWPDLARKAADVRSAGEPQVQLGL